MSIQPNQTLFPSPLNAVQEFHETYGQPVNQLPTLADDALNALRLELIREEFEELKTGVSRGDLTEIADALGDLVYVVYGYALVLGIPLDYVIDEIHRSNMTKLGEDGKPVYREDGKVIKGPLYEPPQIGSVLQYHTAMVMAGRR